LLQSISDKGNGIPEHYNIKLKNPYK